MLIIATGNIRTGKTSLLTAFALTSNKPKIYSNYQIDVKNYTKLTHKNLLEIPNNVDVFIDEAYTWLESRRSNKETNLLASHILYQSGKTFTNIYLDVQELSSLDIRFRKMCNVLIECHKYIEFQLFKYDTFKKIESDFYFVKSKLITFDKMVNVWNKFNTYEIVKSDLAESFEINAILQDSEKLWDTVRDISAEIKPILERDKLNPTYPNITLSMVELKYSVLWIKKLKEFIHAYMNQNIKK